jgi:hypothetical protein
VSLDDTPLKIKSREELPTGNVAFELAIFCKSERVVTHRKIPSTTSQNFMSATYKKKSNQSKHYALKFQKQL